jgi:CBS domain containing-hemolysin-like protein
MTALALLAVFILVLLNGFFVAAEFALVRVRRSRIEEMAGDDRRGKPALVLVLLDDLSRYLASCQLGITFTSLGIGFLGEPAVGRIIEGFFGEGVPHWVSTGVSFAVAYLVTTALHITIGEQVPKIYAIEKAEAMALRVSRPLYLFSKIFRPFIVLLNGASNRLLRLLGINTGGEFEEGGSPEELKQIIAQSLVGGHIDPGEATMLTGVFHLHEQQARQVMTPAPALVTVDVSEDVETALRRCVSSGHTRMIVTEDNNQDRVKGIVHSNQLAQRLLADGPTASIEDLVRDTPIVPETKSLDDLLADLQRERASMAVVIDEYGRTAGIVTVEDIVEEVVGEITDETDPLGGAVRRLANGDWFVRGHVAITDLVDYGLDLPVDSEAYNSVGGFVFGELGRLPRRGDTVQHNGYSIRVESVRENRIEAVRIRERRAVSAAEPADLPAS